MINLIATLIFIATPLTSGGMTPEIPSGIPPVGGSALHQANQPDNGNLRANPIPIILNESVEAHIEFFTTTGKETLQQWFRKSGPYLNLAKKVLKSEGLPEELAYVAMIESGYDSNAVSPARAVGPWQLMEDTALEYGLRIDAWVDERRDIIKSTHAAAGYLQDLFDRFNSWSLAVAAYNAGRGKIVRAVDRTDSLDFWDLKHSGHLRRETRQFVPKFMAVVLIARDPTAYGFATPHGESLRYDEVTVYSRTDLRLVARLSGTSTKNILLLNPHFSRGKTPPGSDSKVRIPAGSQARYQARLKELKHNALVKSISGLFDIFPLVSEWYAFPSDGPDAIASLIPGRLPLYGFFANTHNVRERRKRMGRKAIQQ